MQRPATLRDTTLQVLLIDDDPALSGMLCEFLEGEGIATTPVFNGIDGVTAALSGKYDVVILDIMLPDIDGSEVLRRIRQSGAEARSVPIIMLTAKGGDIDRVVGLEMGADDYVAKPYFARELVARLRAVTRRQREPRQEVVDQTRAGRLTLSSGKREVLWGGHAFELTTTEFDMLDSLMRAGELVSSKEDLSLKVLGRARDAYDRSIDVHVSNLRKKLSIASGSSVEIETIRGVGYRLKVRP